MKLGNLYATRSIESLMQENQKFRDDINASIGKFLRNNWGATCPEDSILNDLAVKTKERVVAVYSTCKGKIWIITEYGHEVTTILFPSEY